MGSGFEEDGQAPAVCIRPLYITSTSPIMCSALLAISSGLRMQQEGTLVQRYFTFVWSPTTFFRLPQGQPREHNLLELYNLPFKGGLEL